MRKLTPKEDRALWDALDESSETVAKGRMSASPACCAAICSCCGKPATCLGAYEGATEKTYACDDCCGHGNEDGHCKPVAA
jgi:hypothetical protein